MSEAPSESGFSGRTMGILIGVGALAFMAVLALMAWSPELTKRSSAGQHPYSKSATGYAAFAALLEGRGTMVQVSRLQRTIESRERGLAILTLLPSGQTKALEELYLEEPVLLVAPKWRSEQRRSKPSWDDKMIPLSEEFAAAPLQVFDAAAELVNSDAPTRIDTPYGTFKPKFIDTIQTLKSDEFEPIIEVDGNILLGRWIDTDVYILSDPDLMNTLGLTEFENARLATHIIDELRYSREDPVIFDATLHGFERSESLLKLALDVPFIGATLTALMAAFLLAWAAVTRFGTPLKEARSIALGKEALAESSAGLIVMAGREKRFAPSYASMIRRWAARSVGAPRTMPDAELAKLLDAMSKSARTRHTYSELSGAMSAPAKNPSDLITKSRRLFGWLKEITHADK